MDKDTQRTKDQLYNQKNWLTSIFKVSEKGRYSKETKKVLDEVKYKMSKGIDPQIAFRDAIISVGLDGMEMEKMEKRTDIAAILWDEQGVDVNPVNLAKPPAPTPESLDELES